MLVNIKVGIRPGGMTGGIVTVRAGSGTETVTVITPGTEAVRDKMQKRRTAEEGPSPTRLTGGEAATCQ